MKFLALILSSCLMAGPSTNVIGDSLMVGIAQQIPKATNLTIVQNNSKVGSRLSQWLKDYPQTDVTIVLIGTNDCGLVKEQDYKAKLRELLTRIHSGKILWFSIPRMINLRFKAKVINEWEQAVTATDDRVIWIDSDLYLKHPDYRAKDGIHCTSKGYWILASSINTYL